MLAALLETIGALSLLASVFWKITLLRDEKGADDARRLTHGHRLERRR